LLDTNAVVALLQGKPPIVEWVRSAAWVGISIISELEFLAFPNLVNEDRELFAEFLDSVNVIGIEVADRDLIRQTIAFRAAHHWKLPDALIAATAATRAAALVSADSQLTSVDGLDLVHFTP
jgi:predicted nucleic acid-binding protein